MKRLHQFEDDSGDELDIRCDHSKRIEDARVLREFHYASLGNYLEENIKRVSCEVFVATFL